MTPFIAHSWTTVTTLSGTGTNFDPFVRMNASNEAVAVWTTGSYPNLSIQASVYDGSTWSSATTISGTGGTFVAPIVGIDSSGNIIALWESIGSGTRDIVAATKPSGSGWNTPQIISSAQENNSSWLAMNGSGEAVAAWINQTDGQVQSASITFGGSWSSVVNITGTGESFGSTQVGIDSSGNGIIVWEDFVNGEVVASQTTGGLGSSWSSSATISSSGSNTGPNISVDASGVAIAAWADYSTNVVYVSLYDSGTWSSPAAISDSSAGYPQVETSGADNFAIWQNFETGQNRGARYVSGSWQSPVDFSVDSPTDIPALSVSSGTSFGFWTDLSTGELKVAEYATTGSPTTPVVISTQDLSINPEVTSSSTATIAAWEAIVGTDHVIQVNID